MYLFQAVKIEKPREHFNLYILTVEKLRVRTEINDIWEKETLRLIALLATGYSIIVNLRGN